MKIKTLALSIAALAGMSLLVNLPAQAADDQLMGNSIGEFTVAKGELTLDAVPTFAFEPTDVKQLVTNGANLAYTNDTITGGKTTGTALTVSDYRGSDQAGWNLNAKLGDFSNKTSTITGTVTYVTDNAAAGTIAAADSTVWNNTDAKTGGVGTATAGTTTSTKLVIPKTTGISSGTYDADLTWALSSTASDTTSD
ncbi:WxL domain-containing protein [Lactiplantibacillus sp. WILCCON 0030]|uniref:WxL domain-containing protein n=1 Tax=Lactiplantibacillus brownii TaxID=3069269 RepID=A0ABU1A9G8_9LACO|nr:WxL domain-containing protein [Lactiplantibacillus brownii]MDQ7937010.1 WxL domain-containing protein [Lactiplantibacillus brownii]